MPLHESVAPEPYPGIWPLIALHLAPQDEDMPAKASGRLQTTVESLTPGFAARRARAVLRSHLLKAQVNEDDAAEMEIVVAELVANAERYAAEPYELRIVSDRDVPIWCDVVDGSPGLRVVGQLLGRLRASKAADLPSLEENGRGLFLVHRLSGGRCAVYPAATSRSRAAGKAVGFALPVGDGIVCGST
ncbi:hypothetical protein Ssi03_46820 [Sphaerisporangium siamense]|uniref:Anti-sigma regulatory factor (Ser/Thr protein kinase) n=1 Tax=Sphaerisporangium siamense TaxID=795645 RepID=A0A7W7D303_9ACTN|nr:ATP-binding protein [Sphaerisporangium siamense]MBB4699181.1 anti-sigma regulatory factor (Ser/Thr protein kinase) [Sphaerisporangium siamense]GII86692.1 hypothetical protein Ssi03_46820 [Sphaerisporangium siamense]